MPDYQFPAMPIVDPDFGDVYTYEQIRGVTVTGLFPYSSPCDNPLWGDIVFNSTGAPILRTSLPASAFPANGGSVVVWTGDIRVRDKQGNVVTRTGFTFSVTGQTPTFTTAPSLSGTVSVAGLTVAQVGATITCNPGQVSGSPTPSPTYQWYANGVLIPGETSSFFVVPGSLDLQVLTCVVSSPGVTPTSTAGATIQFPVAAVNTAALPIPTVSGTVGESLVTVSMTPYFTGQIDQIVLRGTVPAFVSVNGTNINVDRGNATVGSGSFEVAALNSGGTSEYITFNYTLAAAVVLAAVSAPVISGTGYPNNPHGMSVPPQWNKSAAQGLVEAYQWRRRLTANPNDPLVDIAGATDPVTYTTQAGDDGYTIFLQVTATAGIDPAVVQVSNGIAVATQPATFTLSKDGVDLTFADMQANGVYADGVIWVKRAAIGTPRLVSTSPASAQLQRGSGATIYGTYWTHGLMRGPGNAKETKPAASDATIALRQTNNNGVANAASGASQGFDAWTGNTTNYPYSHSKNLDPGAIGAALTLTRGIYVKARSRVNPVDANARPAVQVFVPFVVLDPADPTPNADDYAPASCASSPLSVARKNNKNPITDLPNLSVTTSGVRKTFNELLNIAQTYQVNISALNTTARNIVSPGVAGVHPVYPGDNWRVMEVLLEMCFNNLTSTQKDQLDDYLIAQGLRFAERVNQGWVNVANGGNAGQFKYLVAYASWRLGQPQFLRDALAQTVQGSIPTANYGAMATIGSSVYGDDTMFYRVTQAMIDTPNRAYAPHVAAQLGWADWWDATNATIGGPNNLLMSTDGQTQAKDSYRSTHMMGAAPGALAMRLMGISNILGPLSQPMFDAVDLYMQARIRNGKALPSAGNGNDPAGNGIAWINDAWSQHRGTTGLFTLPTWSNGPVLLVNASPTIGQAGQMPANAQGSISGNLAVNFSVPVVNVTGTFTSAVELWINGVLTETFDFPTHVSAGWPGARRVWFSGQTMVINPTANLQRGQAVEIRIAAGVIGSFQAPQQTYAGAGPGVIVFIA